MSGYDQFLSMSNGYPQQPLPTLAEMQSAIDRVSRDIEIAAMRELWRVMRVTSTAPDDMCMYYFPKSEWFSDAMVIAHPRTVAGGMAANLAAAYSPAGLPVR